MPCQEAGGDGSFETLVGAGGGAIWKTLASSGSARGGRSLFLQCGVRDGGVLGVAALGAEDVWAVVVGGLVHISVAAGTCFQLHHRNVLSGLGGHLYRLPHRCWAGGFYYGGNCRAGNHS